jgi:hypothetical protein
MLRAAASRVRAALLLSDAREARGGEPRELRRLADDARPEVQAGGLVALVRAGFAGVADTRRLSRLAKRGQRATQLALLRAIERMPHERFVAHAVALAESGDVEIQQAALRALRACADPRSLPVALQLLAVRDAREEARRLFVEAGAVGLVFLATALHDPAIALDIRRHVPRTLSRFRGREAERAAAILLDGLARPHADAVLRYKMLRGLGRMKHDNRRLRLDREALVRLGHEALSRAATLRSWRHSLDGDDAQTSTGALLTTLLRRKEQMALERAFRVLDLLRPGGDLERIYDGLDADDAARRATSRELLEYLADPALRREVLALVDHANDRAYAPAAAALAAMAGDRSAAVRALAAEHAAMRPPLAELRRAS